MDFAELYQENCLACHSNGQTLGASISMNNPPYLAVIPKETLRKVVAEGIPHTSMPGLLKQSWRPADRRPDQRDRGGDLQAGRRDMTFQPTIFPRTARPWGMRSVVNRFLRRIVPTATDPKVLAFTGKAGSVVDPTFLSLVSDQYLRTIVIAGRPDLGMPGFRDYVPGKPMSAEEISDVVAWLASRREGTASEQPAQATDATTGAQPSPTNQQ